MALRAYLTKKDNETVAMIEITDKDGKSLAHWYGGRAWLDQVMAQLEECRKALPGTSEPMTRDAAGSLYGAATMNALDPRFRTMQDQTSGCPVVSFEIETDRWWTALMPIPEARKLAEFLNAICDDTEEAQNRPKN